MRLSLFIQIFPCREMYTFFYDQTRIPKMIKATKLLQANASITKRSLVLRTFRILFEVIDVSRFSIQIHYSMTFTPEESNVH